MGSNPMRPASLSRIFGRRDSTAVFSRVFRCLACGISDRDANVSAETANFSPQSLCAIPTVRVWKMRGKPGLLPAEHVALICPDSRHA